MKVDFKRVVLIILHSLICRVMLLRNASDLKNCTSYFGACMWVWYCRPPIGARFHPTPQPPPVPQQLGEKDGSPLRGVARLCRGRRPPLGDRTRLVIIIIIKIIVTLSQKCCRGTVQNVVSKFAVNVVQQIDSAIMSGHQRTP